jgi:hypothetical protein
LTDLITEGRHNATLVVRASPALHVYRSYLHFFICHELGAKENILLSCATAAALCGMEMFKKQRICVR